MILDTLLAETRVRVAQSKATTPAEALREALAACPPPRDLLAVLKRPGVAIIAEVKRASPSKGALNLGLAPAQTALSYTSGGADAISVLTEPGRFQGRLADLTVARRALDGAGCPRPLLRKDFILDPYQLLEARAAGADAVLLIVAALDDATLGHLIGQALALGLTPLVEVHNREELARALALHPPLIGVNNRSLADFTVDLAATRELRPLIPPGCLVVSESGIHDPAQMRELARLGGDAALIGEALVTAPDPVAKLRELADAGR